MEIQSTIIQNIWETGREVYSNISYLKKQEKTQIKNLNLCLKYLRKKSKQNLKLVRKVIKIRAEINEIEMKETIEKINEAKSWFFEQTNKIDKPLARLKEKEGGSDQ